MNTPTLPHLDVGDAWTTSLDKVHDLANAAADVIEDIPDRAIALAGTVIPALRPRTRSRRPFVLLGTVVASLLVVGWLVSRRRRAATGPAPSATGRADTRYAAVS